MSRVHPKKLLVEGNTDKRVLPYLLEANGVTWEAAGEPIVYIEPCDGIDQMLSSAQLRQSRCIKRSIGFWIPRSLSPSLSSTGSAACSSAAQAPPAIS